MNIDTTLGLVGAFLGVFGIILGYVFYQKGLRHKEPCVSIKNFNIINENVTKFAGLGVTYNNASVTALTVSDILFWNKGKETIHGQDISKSDPLRITCKEPLHIFSVNILGSNNKASDFICSLSSQNTFAYISFDYIDEGQGCIIRVVHTGTEKDDISVEGSIKGAKFIRQTRPAELIGEKPKDWLLGGFIWLVSFGMMAGAIIGFSLQILEGESLSWSNILLGFIGFMMFIRYNQLTELKIPSGLQSFLE